MSQTSSSSTKIDGEVPKPQCQSSGYHKSRMRHKSEGRHPSVHFRCPTPNTFAGPWIPPPARTTRGTKYGWQVRIGYDYFSSVMQHCELL